jgi:hypothetical protein
MVDIMRIIIQEPIPNKVRFELELPAGAKALTVKILNGRPYIYFLCSTDMHTELRYFISLSTNKPTKNFVIKGYIDSFEVDNFAFHIFETNGRST